MVEKWCEYEERQLYPAETAQLELIMGAIKAIRHIRAEMNVPPSKKATLVIITEEKETFSKGEMFFKKLAGANDVIVTDDKSLIPENAVSLVSEGAQIYIPQNELVDKEKEIARLKAEEKRLINEIKRVESKLSNEGFIKKAPPEVVAQEREKGEKYRDMLNKVMDGLENLK